jgi:hypothetical protein
MPIHVHTPKLYLLELDRTIGILPRKPSEAQTGRETSKTPYPSPLSDQCTGGWMKIKPLYKAINPNLHKVRIRRKVPVKK